MSHSKVLALDNQTAEGAKRVLMELFAKALRRLQAYHQAASAIQITGGIARSGA